MVGGHVVKRVFERVQQLGHLVVLALLRLCNGFLRQIVAQDHARVGGQHAVLHGFGCGEGVLLQALVPALGPGVKRVALQKQVAAGRGLGWMAGDKFGGALAELPPKQGVVHFVSRHELHEVFAQGVVAFDQGGEAQLGVHAALQRGGEEGFVGLERGHGLLGVVDERHEGLAQAKQVPVGHVGLAGIGIAAAVVGVVANVAGVEGVHELEGAVVDGEAQDAHVVGVHDAVAKAHGLPLGHHDGGALGHLGQQRGVGVGLGSATGVKVRNHKVGQLAQRGVLAAVAEVFEVPKANKAGRHTGDHGGRFNRFAPHGGG